jgi:hypothetical protein
MAKIRVKNFGGMVPLQERDLLPDNYSLDAINTNLYSGSIEGWRVPTATRSLTTPGVKTAFRIPATALAVGYDASSTWVEHAEYDVQLLKSSVQQDTYRRFYRTDTTGAYYNTYARIAAGSSWYILGIPTPSTAATISSTSGGVSVVTEARTYVYTWVSAYGEEGPPSPIVTGTAKVDDTWNLSIPAIGASATGRNITNTRIYRTITSTTGTTTYYRVAEIAVATTTYADTTNTTTLAQSTIIQSTNWTAPPALLQGLVQMPNGIMAGFLGNDVYFSVAYRPHAWPAAFVYTVDYPIVGLGVIGNSLVVCTTANPAIISGSTPSTMSMTRIDTPVPCVSRGSIVSGLDGVYFASEDGLVRVNTSGVEIVTATYVSKHEWTSYAPEYIRGVAYRGGYLAWICGAATNNGFYFAPGDSRVAFTKLMDMGGTVANVQSDPYTGTVYVTTGTQIWEWDPRDSTEYLPMYWSSKRFTTSKRVSFAALRVFTDDISGSATANIWTAAAVNAFVDYNLTDWWRFELYCDGVLIFEGNYSVNGIKGAFIRLPSTTKGMAWRFVVIGRTRIREVQMASSARELADV